MVCPRHCLSYFVGDTPNGLKMTELCQLVFVDVSWENVPIFQTLSSKDLSLIFQKNYRIMVVMAIVRENGQFQGCYCLSVLWNVSLSQIVVEIDWVEQLCTGI